MQLRRIEDLMIDLHIGVGKPRSERERERYKKRSVCLWPHFFVSLQNCLEYHFVYAQDSRQGRARQGKSHVFVEPEAEHGPHTGCDRVGNSMRHGLYYRHAASSFPSSPIEGMLSSSAHLPINFFMGNLWQVHSFFLTSSCMWLLLASHCFPDNILE